MPLRLTIGIAPRLTVGIGSCYMWLEEKVVGSKADSKSFHECKLRSYVSYNLATAAKSSLLQPCTHRPFKCIIEDCNQIFLTYSMKTHYEDKHSSSEMPVEVKKEVIMRPHEMTHVSRLVGGYSKKVT